MFDIDTLNGYKKKLKKQLSGYEGGGERGNNRPTGVAGTAHFNPTTSPKGVLTRHVVGSNWCRVGMKSLIGWQQIGLLRSFPSVVHDTRPKTNPFACVAHRVAHDRTITTVSLRVFFFPPCVRVPAHARVSLAFSRGFELKLLFNSCRHCWILGVPIVRGLRGERQRQRQILCVCVCVCACACREFVVVMN